MLNEERDTFTWEGTAQPVADLRCTLIECKPGRAPDGSLWVHHEAIGLVVTTVSGDVFWRPSTSDGPAWEKC